MGDSIGGIMEDAGSLSLIGGEQIADAVKQSLLEREVESLHTGYDGKIYTVSIADLVMMQMAGDFRTFLKVLPTGKNGTSFEKAFAMIEDIKGKVTTKKLFPSIVEKTVKAQFGEQHTALRELGQNGIDSYEPNDLERQVNFDIAEEENHWVLTARDYGIGMDMPTLVKDLLVPYNSGKEFDPTKIGEHGIGWYSIVDISDIVKVTTRTRDTEDISQIMVYCENNDWKAVIKPNSKEGFSPKFFKEPFGTEVMAYIPKESTTRDDLKQSLYKFLGMVDMQQAQIILDNEVINSINKTYKMAAPISVIINNKQQLMTMGASKREMGSRAFSDSRFKDRNDHLDELLITQRGLFVKYEEPPFSANTIHEDLISKLIEFGIDVTVAIPEKATLTKGRNDIVADQKPAVIEGMYRAFESLFLDVLLGDDEVLYHPSGIMLKHLASMLKKNVGTLKGAHIQKYSFKKRFITKSVAIASGTVDIGRIVATYTGKFGKKAGMLAAGGLYSLAAYPFTKMPHHLYSAGNWIGNKAVAAYNYTIANKGKVAAYTGIGIAGLAGLGGAGYGIYRLVNIINWPLFGKIAGISAASAAGLGLGYLAVSKMAENERLRHWVLGVGGFALGGSALGYGINYLNHVLGQYSYLPWAILAGAVATVPVSIGAYKLSSKAIRGTLNLLAKSKSIGYSALSFARAANSYIVPLAASVGAAGALGGLTYGMLSAYNAYGAKSFIGLGAIGGAVVLGSVGKTVYKHWPGIKNGLEGMLEDLAWVGNGLGKAGRYVVSGRLFGDIYKVAGDCTMWGLKKVGLYRDLDAKRERKREKRIKKISKAYISELHTIEFIARILHKKIIHAKYYFSPNSEKESFTERLSGLGPEYGTTIYSALNSTIDERELERIYRSFGRKSLSKIKEAHKEAKIKKEAAFLETRDIKISIDDMILLYLEGKLRFNGMRFQFDPSKNLKKHGDYYVDRNNPLIEQVVEKLLQIEVNVANTYDVKILEDRLDNIWDATRNIGAFAYMTTFGWALLLASKSLGLKGKFFPLKDTTVFQKYDNGLSALVENLKGADYSGFFRKKGESLKKAGLFVAKKGYKLPIYAAIGLYLVGGFVGNGIWEGMKYSGKGIRYAGRSVKQNGQRLIQSGADSISNAGVNIMDAILAYFSARYNDVLVPSAKALNPARYPQYITDGYKKISNFSLKKMREERRQLREKHRQHREETRGKKKKSLDETMEKAEAIQEKQKERVKEKARSFGEWISRLYTSIYNSLMGGISSRLAVSIPSPVGMSPKPFRGVRKSSIEAIVSISGMGEAYTNYFMIHEKLDNLIFEATGIPVYRMDIDWESISPIYGCYQSRKYGYSINLSQTENDIPTCKSKYKGNWCGLYFKILDSLIYLKARDAAVKPYLEDLRNKIYVQHEVRIFQAYSEIKSRVLDYVFKNNIDIVEMISKDMKSNPEPLFESFPRHIMNNMIFMSNKNVGLFSERLKDYILNPRKYDLPKIDKFQAPPPGPEMHT